MIASPTCSPKPNQNAGKISYGMHSKHNDASVSGDTIKVGERDLLIQRFIRNVIEYVAHITHAEQPATGRCSSPIEDGVSPRLDGPIAPL